jgi:hypothetical protein
MPRPPQTNGEIHNTSGIEVLVDSSQNFLQTNSLDIHTPEVNVLPSPNSASVTKFSRFLVDNSGKLSMVLSGP